MPWCGLPNGSRLSCGASAGGRSAPPCGTSWPAHQRTLPLKAGPGSFKRLLGGRLNEPPQGATTRTDDPLDDVTGPVAPVAGGCPGWSSRYERPELRPLCGRIVQKAQAFLSGGDTPRLPDCGADILLTNPNRAVRL